MHSDFALLYMFRDNERIILQAALLLFIREYGYPTLLPITEWPRKRHFHADDSFKRIIL